MKNFNKTGFKTALFSFLIGTIIFTAYFFTANYILLCIGGFFIVIAGIFNVVILILLATEFNNKISRKQSLRTSALMLLNIPVMIIYIWITSLLLDNMRITLINKTSSTISNINISGCETKHVDILYPNKTTTIWVKIKGDCHINLSYNIDEQKKHKTIVYYATTGDIITHKIEEKNLEH